MAETPVRLGGMALQNGVLVHGPTSWGCAVRDDDGVLHVASGRKPHLARNARQRMPILRGPIAIAEAFALLPTVRRAIPQARFPFERPSVLGAILGTAVAARALRRSRLSAGHARDRCGRRSVPAGCARAAGAGSGRLPRGGAHLHRHVRERRDARSQGASPLRLAAHRADGRIVARGERRRVEGAGRYQEHRAARGDGGRDRRLRRGLLVGRPQPVASRRACPRQARLRAPAPPVDGGAVGRSARGRERRARRLSRARASVGVIASAPRARCR